MSQVSADGTVTDATVPLTVLVSRVKNESTDTERVSSGTKFALGLWQQSLDTFDP